MVEILKDNLAKLNAAGFNVMQRTIDLSIAVHRANDAEAAQVAAEIAHKEATAKSVERTENAYKLASETVDLIVGIIGRDDELSKTLRDIRGEMNR